MTQSIVGFPESADFEICGHIIKIRFHKIIHHGGFFALALNILADSDANRQTLAEFEGHGISYESFIECCITELEENPETFARIINWIDHTSQQVIPLHSAGKWDHVLLFSQSSRGMEMAEEFEEKIRNYENWGEFYDDLKPASKFIKEMKKHLKMEIKQWHKV